MQMDFNGWTSKKQNHIPPTPFGVYVMKTDRKSKIDAFERL
jgi:hypothetical protein